MDEARLVAKLKALEALFAGAATDGERTAAAYARDRMLGKPFANDVLNAPPESPASRYSRGRR